jgi:hypothetical protein
MPTTFRAAFTTETADRGEIRLTGPEHAELTDEQLIEEALDEADRVGLDVDEDNLTIADWTEA